MKLFLPAGLDRAVQAHGASGQGYAEDPYANESPSAMLGDETQPAIRIVSGQSG